VVLQGTANSLLRLLFDQKSDVHRNLFLLRDDREAGHLLISAIRERLGSPAGEAINGSREETSIKRRREKGTIIDG